MRKLENIWIRKTRKLDNKWLRNVYSLINNIKMIKLRRVGVLVGKYACKRPLGRSRRRWEDNINGY
jgi:hypothetical protein